MPTDLADLAVHTWVKDSFQPYLGRKYTWILDQLRPLIRNAIAHLDPTGVSLVADRFEDVDRCERALPVVKYLARDMLRNELAMDSDTACLKVG